MSTENPLCPSCQTELEDDFGIVDCKSCGAVCSVDLNGEVSLQEEIEEGSDFIEASLEEEEEALQTEELLETEEVEALEGDDSPVAIDYYHEQEDYAVEKDPEVLESEVDEENAPPSIIEEPIDYLKEQEASEVLSEPMEALSFLKDLEVFTEESSSESLDHIYYDLTVKGLDSGDLRDLFIETASDERLDLSEDYLGALIEGESCVIPQLSFLRLQVVYKRLISMGFKLGWSLSKEQRPVIFEPDLGDGSEEEVYSEDAEDY